MRLLQQNAGFYGVSYVVARNREGDTPATRVF